MNNLRQARLQSKGVWSTSVSAPHMVVKHSVLSHLCSLCLSGECSVVMGISTDCAAQFSGHVHLLSIWDVAGATTELNGVIESLLIPR